MSKKLTALNYLNEVTNFYIGNKVRLKWSDRFYKITDINFETKRLILHGFEGELDPFYVLEIKR